MKLFISSIFENESLISKERQVEKIVDLSKLHILQSFAYVKAIERFERALGAADFLLDSGAFTFMNGKKSREFDIVGFTRKYGEFVKKWNIDNFLELDVDSVFGMETYVKCLHLLQDITGKDPVRVMHTWRGKEYFEELTKKKKFVCLGGIAGTQNLTTARSNLQWFVDTAHKNGCRIHGLGIGTMNVIRKNDFDSVDSANWLASVKFGKVLHFNGHEIVKYDSGERAGKDERIDTTFVANTAIKAWEQLSHYVDLF